jgi:hypothetical protein
MFATVGTCHDAPRAVGGVHPIIENRGQPFETALRASSGRNGRGGHPFVLRSPEGASRSTDDLFNRLLIWNDLSIDRCCGAVISSV